MAVAKIKEKFQVTIPASIRKRLAVKVGDVVDVREEQGRIVILPVVTIDPSQDWFWSEPWQKGEREAGEDIKHGRVSKPFPRGKAYEKYIEGLKKGRRT